MDSQILNVLVTTFAGLGLPSTLCIPVATSTSLSELTSNVLNRLPCSNARFILTTTSNGTVDSTSSAPASSLLSGNGQAFIPLRLSCPILGGKGGFGSQLRAAGGRMSSRRKKNQGENNSSNRNLDGRRLRTVTEAKALAEYLALKPEMERKGKEASRKRWEQVVEMIEKREAEVKSGSKGRVDGKWVEDKEEASERARDAVIAAMRSGNYQDNLKDLDSDDSESAERESERDEDESMEDAGHSSHSSMSPQNAAEKPVRTYFGFDDGDESTSEEEVEDSDKKVNK